MADLRNMKNSLSAASTVQPGFLALKTSPAIYITIANLYVLYTMSQANMTVEDHEGPQGWGRIRKHLNFYRVHVMYYVFTPLFFSGIFYASNGRYHFAYIDSLYNCVSAMTAIIFTQMCIGCPILVSWVTVYIRRHYFAIKFRNVLKANAERKAAEVMANPERRGSLWPKRLTTFFRAARADLPIAADGYRGAEEKKGIIQKLRPDMIRKIDNEPKRINPSGLSVASTKAPTAHGTQPRHLSFPPSSSNHAHPQAKSRRTNIDHDGERKRHHYRRLSDPGARSRPIGSFPWSDTMQDKPMRHATWSPGLFKAFTRTQTVTFAPEAPRPRSRPVRARAADETENEKPEPEPVLPTTAHGSMHSRQTSLPRHPSVAAEFTRIRELEEPQNRGFGGFPMPFTIITNLVSRLCPKFGRRVTRAVTIPATTSLVSRSREAPPGSKTVPYVSFDAVVGRNSAFYHLTREEMEELGGVEYRALNALLWIIAGYHIISQLIGFIVIAPYISTPRWRDNFLEPAEIRPVSSIWFSGYQVVSAYTNTGMSLVDKSMVPFQMAYPMIFFMAYLILAGNTAYPVFLRFTIWVLSKLVSKVSRANETFHFLLDHPRRCYIFLFPSHQTWFLLTVVIGLTVTDWFFFMVLDIKNPAISSIPLGTRFVAGLLQALAVRAAGFGIVPLASLAAGVKFLYVIMMYISVYPIGMSIRSTNVYEEQSLGIFKQHHHPGDEDFEAKGHRMKIWGRYLAMHMRRQLVFDMWWLCAAVFLICIIERHNLDNPDVAVWFNVFTVIFEVVSAYGTVGLSLGTPNNNFSLSGEFRSLSKFIIILLMIAGRHRILPVAIDRAVMLPSELQAQLDQEAGSRSMSQPGSHGHEEATFDGRIHSRRHSSQVEIGESRRRNHAYEHSPGLG